MEKHIFIVFTNAKDGQEAEFNDWYTNRHVGDVLKIPGIVSATRYELSDFQRPTPHPWKYMAIYEIETDDLKSVSDEISRRAGTPLMIRSDAMAPEIETHFYAPMQSAVSE